MTGKHTGTRAGLLRLLQVRYGGKEELRNTGEQEKGRGKDKQRQEVKSCNT